MNRILKFIISYILTFGSLIFIFTVGIFFSRFRWLIRKVSTQLGIDEIMGGKTEPPELKLPTTSVDEILPFSDNPIACPAAKDGNISTLELLVINSLVRSCNPKNVFEIGTFNGRTTLNLALNSMPDATVYTLDLPAKEEENTTYSIEEFDKLFIRKAESGSVYKTSELSEKQKISQLYGDSGSFDFSPYLNEMDFVFVDGSHHYEYIINDSDIALKLLKNGKGMIMWHDYDPGWPGVAMALNDICRKEPFDGMVHIKDTSLVMLRLDKG